MKFFFISVCVVFSLFFYSCSSNNENVVKLELNRGEKWKVNSETHLAMNNLKLLLATSEPQNKTDFESLAEKIQNECNFMISNCSMTGVGHDQLHEVLHPILTQLELLLNSEKSIEELHFALKTMRGLVLLYFDYFEE